LPRQSVLPINRLLCSDISYEKAKKLSRVVDLDVDIGADAIDYKCAVAHFHVPVLVLTLFLVQSQTRNLCQDLKSKCASWKGSSKRSLTIWAT
jgi:hypothetical protein